jgi:hypothetical protein
MTNHQFDQIVSASRLAMGQWSHERNKQLNEGDISAAYSADTIASQGKIRRPFRLMGWLYTTVSMSGTAHNTTATAYRLVAVKHFEGTPRTYQESFREPRSEKGFYGGQKHVLVGPKVAIGKSGTAKPTQGSLL